MLAYLVYVFFAFDIAGLAERARLDNAKILSADAYSHKTHVERDNRTAASRSPSKARTRAPMRPTPGRTG